MTVTATAPVIGRSPSSGRSTPTHCRWWRTRSGPVLQSPVWYNLMRVMRCDFGLAVQIWWGRLVGHINIGPGKLNLCMYVAIDILVVRSGYVKVQTAEVGILLFHEELVIRFSSNQEIELFRKSAVLGNSRAYQPTYRR